MSIVIKGVEMPKESWECPCHNGETGRCKVTGRSCYDIPKDCPLIEIQTPPRMSDDTISRQAAIDALHMHLMYRMGTDSNKKRLDDWINSLPSAQPEKRTEERTKTHACDCISRAEAIELKPEFLNPNVNRKTKEQTAIGRAYARGWNSCNTHWIKEIIEDLPSVQPETAKRIVGKSRDGMTLWYQCDMCNEPVDAQDNFCSGCGRRLVNE